MRILIAPDKFKGSLTAQQVCKAIEAGLRKVFPNEHVIQFPLADGGEGTQDIFLHYLKGNVRSKKVHDPLGRIINARYILSSDQKKAFIELASTSGLNLLEEQERNPMETSTVGAGELILDALEHGAGQIIFGIGGTATNDASLGAASVLGYEFLDEKNRPVLPTGKNLLHIHKILTENVHPGLEKTKFIAMCDVANPFSGQEGAAFTYAPQKGASPEEVLFLDKGLKHIANIIQRDVGIDIDTVPGAGAGGGFGGGAIAFFGATLQKGIDVVFEITEFEEQLKNADLIITGEGKLDRQTLQGKLVQGVCTLAKKHSKKALCLVGRNELSIRELQHLGCEAVFSITEHTAGQDALQNAYGMVEKIAAQSVTAWIENNC